MFSGNLEMKSTAELSQNETEQIAWKTIPRLKKTINVNTTYELKHYTYFLLAVNSGSFTQVFMMCALTVSYERDTVKKY